MLAVEPDLMTCFHTKSPISDEKKDILSRLGDPNLPDLFVAVNFKNPPGRILRR